MKEGSEDPIAAAVREIVEAGGAHMDGEIPQADFEAVVYQKLLEVFQLGRDDGIEGTR